MEEIEFLRSLLQEYSNRLLQANHENIVLRVENMKLQKMVETLTQEKQG